MSWFKKKPKESDGEKAQSCSPKRADDRAAFSLPPKAATPPQLSPAATGGHYGYSLSREDLDKLTGKDCKPILDQNYLEENLCNIGDEQPLVARCTPKSRTLREPSQHAQDWDMRHCLYTRDVYDRMVTDSLNTCELLQHNLDDLITQVRSRPPSDEHLPAVNGHAETDHPDAHVNSTKLTNGVKHPLNGSAVVARPVS